MAARCVGYVINMPGHHCRALYDPKTTSFLALSSVLIDQATPSEAVDGIHWHQWEPMVLQHYSKPQGFALVPAQLYDPQSAEEVLKVNGVMGEPPVRIDPIEGPNAHLLYYPRQPIEQGSVYAALLNYQFSHIVPLLDSVLHFHVNIDSIFIALIQDRELKLANLYPFAAKEDILYYIAAGASQFGFDLQKEVVTYSGFLRPKTQLNALLAKYIGKLKPLKCSKDISFDVAFNAIPKHFYSDVFILPTCG